MEHYLTSTELRQNLKRAKELAQTGIVHVLEDGRTGYVFCSLGLYNQVLERSARQAAWEAEVAEFVRDGEQDISKKRMVPLSEVIDARQVKNDGALRMLVTRSTKAILRDSLSEMDLRVLNHALDSIAMRSDFGITVEFQNTDRIGLGHVASEVQKVLVPPYDLIYWPGEGGKTIVIIGVVRSLDGLW